MRVLSGVQPTGNLHLGNYLGAIRNWVGMQDKAECLFMLADLHAITVPQDPAALLKNTRETAAAYIACGIDPSKSSIFHQSAVTAHAELAWILNCHTPLGWLNRMTQFKEKIQESKSGAQEAADDLERSIEELENIFRTLNKNANATLTNPSSPIVPTGAIERLKITLNSLKESTKLKNNAVLGLFAYPVLMASDILVYKATHVPVGEDQKQHLELCRDIAGAFNRHYGREVFPVPEPLILGEATRVMSLRDGTKKMSKSDASDYSRVNLTDDVDTIAQKFRKAKSDMVEGISYEPDARPEAANLLNIYAALSDQTREQALASVAGMNFSAFKALLTEVAVDKLSPITKRMRELCSYTPELDAILAEGTTKARAIAERTMREVRDVVGFLQL